MLIRESKLLYPVFHRVDTTSKRNGGELVAQVLKSHGVDKIFTSPGEHISPIAEASNRSDIKVVDVSHGAAAIFAANNAAKLSGVAGVAIVTTGSDLANTVTAIKNTQKAETPVVLIAVGTMRKNQDRDQISQFIMAFKKSYTVVCVRDIIPTLREAFRLAQVEVPGPVLVELSTDLLYPYSIVAQQFAATSSLKSKAKKTSIKNRLIEAYTNYSLNYIFADAFKDQDVDPLPLSVKDFKKLGQVANSTRHPGRPLLHILREGDESFKN